jgi:exodeoxyribonuclease-1
MEKTYLFYDLETTGLNPCFDQILQFAAIRTDLELRALEEYNIRIKLNSDVIPAPQAILTHNISIEQMQEGICEYEAIKKIHALVNQPGTISLGYNTLGFDDEFLRFAFYRNLLPPYTHQFANSCSRMDLYPILVMFYLFKRDVLQWPEINGKLSLKLEYLSSKNNLLCGDAHDALVDAKATLELARKLSQETEMWNYLQTYFDKAADEDRMLKLSEAIMVDGKYGFDNFYQIPLLQLGKHNHYKNQTLWLRLDLPIPEQAPEKAFIIRKRAGDLGLLLPMQKRFTQYLSTERQQIVVANKKWLAANNNQLEEIITYSKDYKYPEVPNVDVDAALYQIGFPSNYELKLCAQFHAKSLTEKLEMVDKFSHQLRTQAIRLLGRNYPRYLPEQLQQEYDEYLEDINQGNSVDYKSQPRYNRSQAEKEVTELLLKELTEQQRKLLKEFADYLEVTTKIFPKQTKIIPSHDK